MDVEHLGISVKIKEEAVRKARQEHGFFALISNEVKSPVTALGLYRSKDVVEKAFGNLKERLNCRRFLTSSEASLNGKLFVEFIALIYLSYIHRKRQKAGLYKKFTMEQLLMELDSIQAFCEPGRTPIVGDILTKHTEIYKGLDVQPQR